MHTINRPSLLRIVPWCVLVTLIGSTELAWSQPPSPAAAGANSALPQSVMVLRSGQVLKGQAALRGDEWVITVPEGEIRLRACEVECCSSSIEEAYMRLRAASGQGSVYDHLRLAQWCIRHNLPQQAEQEIADVAAIEPKHPMLGMLRRRIEYLRSPAAEVTLTSVTSPEVSGTDLERLVRGLPPGTMESFVRWVQPLVVNNCSSAGCHGAMTESNFRISRFTASEPPSRSVTLRNFHAVLQCVDHDNPAASKLLVVPLRPHGTAKAAVFTDPNAGSYSRMVEWVYRVTNHPYPGPKSLSRIPTSPISPSGQDPWAGSAPPGTAPFASDDPSRAPAILPTNRTGALRQTSASGRGTYAGHSATASRSPDVNSTAKRHAGNRSHSSVEPDSEVSSSLPARAGETQDGAADASASDSAPRHTGVQRGARTSNATPATDPFDPEVFNRRFGDQSR